MKLKVGDRIKWKGSDDIPFDWQLKEKITATGVVTAVIDHPKYQYYCTSSEAHNPSEGFLVESCEIEKLKLNMENK